MTEMLAGLKDRWGRTRQFLTDVMIELRHKVTWPTRKEVTGTTLVVLVATLVFAVYLAALDWGLMAVVEFVLRQVTRS